MVRFRRFREGGNSPICTKPSIIKSLWMRTPPRKINISPENQWLEDVFSYWNSPFLGDMLILRGVNDATGVLLPNLGGFSFYSPFLLQDIELGVYAHHFAGSSQIFPNNIHIFCRLPNGQIWRVEFTHSKTPQMPFLFHLVAWIE